MQEAVAVELVPQIASEGNARDLLEEIRKEKLSHGFANSYGICDGKNKKSKSSDLRSKSPQRNAPASVVRVTKKNCQKLQKMRFLLRFQKTGAGAGWGRLCLLEYVKMLNLKK